MRFTFHFLCLGLATAQYLNSPYENDLRLRDVDGDIDWFDLDTRDIEEDDFMNDNYRRDYDDTWDLTSRDFAPDSDTELTRLQQINRIGGIFALLRQTYDPLWDENSDLREAYSKLGKPSLRIAGEKLDFAKAERQLQILRKPAIQKKYRALLKAVGEGIDRDP